MGGSISLAAAIGHISDYRYLYGWQEIMIRTPPRASASFSGSEGGTAPCQVIGKRSCHVFAWISNYNLFPKDWTVSSQKIKSKKFVHKSATKIVSLQASLHCQFWFYPAWLMSEIQQALAILPWSLTRFSTTVNAWQGAAFPSTCYTMQDK